MRQDEQTLLSGTLGSRPQAARGPQLKHLVLVWWLLCLVASPFYVFKSGNPQPADAGMGVLILLLLTGYFARIPLHQTLYFVAALFLTVVALVNWFWWTQVQDLKLLLSSIYYLYDFLVVVVILALAREFGADFWKITRIALIASLLVEVTIILFLPELRGTRASGTFNNPNQLGYWTVLTAACYLSLKPGGGQPSARLTFLDVGVLCLLGYVAMQSLSKAAMGAFLVLFLAAIYCQGASLRVKFALAGVLLIGAGVIAIKSVDDIRASLADNSAGHVIDRFAAIGDESDSLEGRGYDRIWEHPEYLILGAGEGGRERFDSVPNEIHSTFATVLFSYGIFGFAFFLAILWIIFRDAEWRHFIYFGAIGLYGLTHQGLRDAMLWIFLGLVFAQTRYGQPLVAKPSRDRLDWAAQVRPVRKRSTVPPVVD